MYGVAFMHVVYVMMTFFTLLLLFVVTKYYFCREALLFYDKNLSSFKQILKLKNFYSQENYLKMLFLISLQEKYFLIFTKK